MMQTGLRFVVGLTLLALYASPAAAQEARRWGLLFAYPGSVGVQWDATEKFALRVDADFSRSKTTFTNDFGDLPPGFSIEPSTETLTSAFGSIGISGLFILHAANPLKLYVAPRVALTMNRQTLPSISLFAVTVDGVPLPSDSIGGPAEREIETDTTRGFDASAKFGASYRLGERFAVFGETGFGYQRDSRSESGGSGVRSSTIGLRAGVGGILYF
jgi:hypothetical protein